MILRKSYLAGAVSLLALISGGAVSGALAQTEPADTHCVVTMEDNTTASHTIVSQQNGSARKHQASGGTLVDESNTNSAGSNGTVTAETTVAGESACAVLAGTGTLTFTSPADAADIDDLGLVSAITADSDAKAIVTGGNISWGDQTVTGTLSKTPTYTVVQAKVGSAATAATAEARYRQASKATTDAGKVRGAGVLLQTGSKTKFILEGVTATNSGAGTAIAEITNGVFEFGGVTNVTEVGTSEQEVGDTRHGNYGTILAATAADGGASLIVNNSTFRLNRDTFETNTDGDAVSVSPDSDDYAIHATSASDGAASGIVLEIDKDLPSGGSTIQTHSAMTGAVRLEADANSSTTVDDLLNPVTVTIGSATASTKIETTADSSHVLYVSRDDSNSKDADVTITLQNAELKAAGVGSHAIWVDKSNASPAGLGEAIITLNKGSKISAAGTSAYAMKVEDQAATVTIGQSASGSTGDVTVTGDLSFGTAADAITINGGDDGATTPVGVTVTGDIALGEGNNSLTVGGTLTGTVTAGAGADTVTVVAGATVTAAPLNLGAGNNVILGSGTGDKTLGAITLGTGADIIGYLDPAGPDGDMTTTDNNPSSADITAARQLVLSGAVTLGAGANTVHAKGVSSTGLITGGAGADDIDISGDVSGAITLDAGDDTVKFGGVLGAGVTISTGDGKDVVTVEDGASGTGTIDLGSGGASGSLLNRQKVELKADTSIGISASGTDTWTHISAPSGHSGAINITATGSTGTLIEITGNVTQGINVGNRATVTISGQLNAALDLGVQSDTVSFAGGSGDVDLGDGVDTLTLTGGTWSGDLTSNAAGNNTINIQSGASIGTASRLTLQHDDIIRGAAASGEATIDGNIDFDPESPADTTARTFTLGTASSDKTDNSFVTLGGAVSVSENTGQASALHLYAKELKASGSITGGSGKDIISLDTVAAGDDGSAASISLGAGGSGQDQQVLEIKSATNASISAAGPTSLTVGGELSGGVTLSGEDNDVVIAGMFTGSTLLTGPGSDNVSFAGGSGDVDLGDGSDTLTLTGGTWSGDLTSSAAGNNTINIQSGASIGPDLTAAAPTPPTLTLQHDDIIRGAALTGEATIDGNIVFAPESATETTARTFTLGTAELEKAGSSHLTLGGAVSLQRTAEFVTNPDEATPVMGADVLRVYAKTLKASGSITGGAGSDTVILDSAPAGDDGSAATITLGAGGSAQDQQVLEIKSATATNVSISATGPTSLTVGGDLSGGVTLSGEGNDVAIAGMFTGDTMTTGSGSDTVSFAGGSGDVNLGDGQDTLTLTGGTWSGDMTSSAAGSNTINIQSGASIGPDLTLAQPTLPTLTLQHDDIIRGAALTGEGTIDGNIVFAPESPTDTTARTFTLGTSSATKSGSSHLILGGAVSVSENTGQTSALHLYAKELKAGGSITGGGGKDMIVLDTVSAGDDGSAASINLGAGGTGGDKQILEIKSATNASISAAGPTSITVGGDLSVGVNLSGEGNDVAIEGIFTGDTMTTGPGSDNVSLAGGSGDVDLGDGQDTLTLTGGTWSGDMISSAAGNNTINIQSGALIGPDQTAAQPTPPTLTLQHDDIIRGEALTGEATIDGNIVFAPESPADTTARTFTLGTAEIEKAGSSHLTLGGAVSLQRAEEFVTNPGEATPVMGADVLRVYAKTLKASGSITGGAGSDTVILDSGGSGPVDLGGNTGGLDRLTLTGGTWTGNYTQTDGNGHMIVAAGAIADGGTVDLGAGSNTVTVSGELRNNPAVRAGGGDDTVTLNEGGTLEKVTFELGGGTNKILGAGAGDKTLGAFTIGDDGSYEIGDLDLQKASDLILTGEVELGDGLNKVRIKRIESTGSITGGTGEYEIEIAEDLVAEIDLGGGTSNKTLTVRGRLLVGVGSEATGIDTVRINGGSGDINLMGGTNVLTISGDWTGNYGACETTNQTTDCEGGDGSDSLILDEGATVSSRSGSLALGLGNDSVTINEDASLSGATLELGPGDDSLTIASDATLMTGSGSVDLGLGNDLMTIDVGASLAGAALDFGEGNNTLLGAGSGDKTLGAITLGGGDDIIGYLDPAGPDGDLSTTNDNPDDSEIEAARQLVLAGRVELGDGDNTVRVTKVEEDARITGGRGIDDIQVSGDLEGRVDLGGDMFGDHDSNPNTPDRVMPTNNTLTVGGNISGNVVSAATGTDEVTVNGGAKEDNTGDINLGHGTNRVMLNAGWAGEYTGGDGDDEITMADGVTVSNVVTLGRGDNRIDGLGTAGVLEGIVDALDGDDTIMGSLKLATVRLGHGNNTIMAESSGAITVGNHDDTITLTGDASGAISLGGNMTVSQLRDVLAERLVADNQGTTYVHDDGTSRVILSEDSPLAGNMTTNSQIAESLVRAGGVPEIDSDDNIVSVRLQDGDVVDVHENVPFANLAKYNREIIIAGNLNSYTGYGYSGNTLTLRDITSGNVESQAGNETGGTDTVTVRNVGVVEDGEITARGVINLGNGVNMVTLLGTLAGSYTGGGGKDTLSICPLDMGGCVDDDGNEAPGMILGAVTLGDGDNALRGKAALRETVQGGDGNDVISGYDVIPGNSARQGFELTLADVNLGNGDNTIRAKSARGITVGSGTDIITLEGGSSGSVSLGGNLDGRLALAKIVRDGKGEYVPGASETRVRLTDKDVKGNLRPNQVGQALVRDGEGTLVSGRLRLSENSELTGNLTPVQIAEALQRDGKGTLDGDRDRVVLAEGSELTGNLSKDQIREYLLKHPDYNGTYDAARNTVTLQTGDKAGTVVDLDDDLEDLAEYNREIDLGGNLAPYNREIDLGGNLDIYNRELDSANALDDGITYSDNTLTLIDVAGDVTSSAGNSVGGTDTVTVRNVGGSVTLGGGTNMLALSGTLAGGYSGGEGKDDITACPAGSCVAGGQLAPAVISGEVALGGGDNVISGNGKLEMKVTAGGGNDMIGQDYRFTDDSNRGNDVYLELGDADLGHGENVVRVYSAGSIATGNHTDEIRIGKGGAKGDISLGGNMDAALLREKLARDGFKISGNRAAFPDGYVYDPNDPKTYGKGNLTVEQIAANLVAGGGVRDEAANTVTLGDGTVVDLAGNLDQRNRQIDLAGDISVYLRTSNTLVAEGLVEGGITSDAGDHGGTDTVNIQRGARGTVDLGGGANNLTVSGTLDGVAADAYIGGDGADTISICPNQAAGDCAAGDVKIIQAMDLGGGNNVIQGKGIVEGAIRAGAGDDMIGPDYSGNTHLSLMGTASLGEGRNTIRVQSTRAITVGNSRDVIDIKGAAAGNIHLGGNPDRDQTGAKLVRDGEGVYSASRDRVILNEDSDLTGNLTVQQITASLVAGGGTHNQAANTVTLESGDVVDLGDESELKRYNRQIDLGGDISMYNHSDNTLTVGGELLGNVDSEAGSSREGVDRGTDTVTIGATTGNISLGGGRNVLTLMGSLTGDYTGGDGVDSIVVNCAANAGCRLSGELDLKNGDNTIRIDQNSKATVFTSESRILLGDGNDTIIGDSLRLNAVNLGDGKNTLAVGGADEITAGSGDDGITVRGNVTGTIQLGGNLGAGLGSDDPEEDRKERVLIRNHLRDKRDEATGQAIYTLQEDKRRVVKFTGAPDVEVDPADHGETIGYLRNSVGYVSEDTAADTVDLRGESGAIQTFSLADAGSRKSALESAGGVEEAVPGGGELMVFAQGGADERIYYETHDFTGSALLLSDNTVTTARRDAQGRVAEAWDVLGDIASTATGKDIVEVRAVSGSVTLGDGENTLTLMGNMGGGYTGGSGRDTLTLASLDGAEIRVSGKIEMGQGKNEISGHFALGGGLALGGDDDKVGDIGKPLDDISNTISIGGTLDLGEGTNSASARIVGGIRAGSGNDTIRVLSEVGGAIDLGGDLDPEDRARIRDHLVNNHGFTLGAGGMRLTKVEGLMDEEVNPADLGDTVRYLTGLDALDGLSGAYNQGAGTFTLIVANGETIVRSLATAESRKGALVDMSAVAESHAAEIITLSDGGERVLVVKGGRDVTLLHETHDFVGSPYLRTDNSLVVGGGADAGDVGGAITSTATGTDTVDIGEVRGDISLGGGLNTLTLGGTLAGGYTGGDGVDTILVDVERVSSCGGECAPNDSLRITGKVSMGEGKNTIMGNAVLEGSLEFGGGDDRVGGSMDSAQMHSRDNLLKLMDVDLGNGKNTLVARGAGTIKAGSGEDTIHIYGDVAGNLAPADGEPMEAANLGGDLDPADTEGAIRHLVGNRDYKHDETAKRLTFERGDKDIEINPADIDATVAGLRALPTFQSYDAAGRLIYLAGYDSGLSLHTQAERERAIQLLGGEGITGQPDLYRIAQGGKDTIIYYEAVENPFANLADLLTDNTLDVAGDITGSVTSESSGTDIVKAHRIAGAVSLGGGRNELTAIGGIDGSYSGGEGADLIVLKGERNMLSQIDLGSDGSSPAANFNRLFLNERVVEGTAPARAGVSRSVLHLGGAKGSNDTLYICNGDSDSATGACRPGESGYTYSFDIELNASEGNAWENIIVRDFAGNIANSAPSYLTVKGSVALKDSELREVTFLKNQAAGDVITISEQYGITVDTRFELDVDMKSSTSDLLVFSEGAEAKTGPEFINIPLVFLNMMDGQRATHAGTRMEVLQLSGGSDATEARVRIIRSGQEDRLLQENDIVTQNHAFVSQNWVFKSEEANGGKTFFFEAQGAAPELTTKGEVAGQYIMIAASAAGDASGVFGSQIAKGFSIGATRDAAEVSQSAAGQGGGIPAWTHVTIQEKKEELPRIQSGQYLTSSWFVSSGMEMYSAETQSGAVKHSLSAQYGKTESYYRGGNLQSSTFGVGYGIKAIQNSGTYYGGSAGLARVSFEDATGAASSLPQEHLWGYVISAELGREIALATAASATGGRDLVIRPTARVTQSEFPEYKLSGGVTVKDIHRVSGDFSLEFDYSETVQTSLGQLSKRSMYGAAGIDHDLKAGYRVSSDYTPVGIDVQSDKSWIYLDFGMSWSPDPNTRSFIELSAAATSGGESKGKRNSLTFGYELNW